MEFLLAVIFYLAILTSGSDVYLDQASITSKVVIHTSPW
jgi:hypothetical protein